MGDCMNRCSEKGDGRQRLGCLKRRGFGKCTKSGDVLGERFGLLKKSVLEVD